MLNMLLVSHSVTSEMCGCGRERKLLTCPRTDAVAILTCSYRRGQPYTEVLFLSRQLRVGRVLNER